MNDGGSAFPCPAFQTRSATFPALQGMSLRDYFAAAALQGWCAGDTKEWDLSSENVRASACYKMADAMLAEREKK